MEASGRNSGYPESVIGDAASMKGRMKRAEDVSRDGVTVANEDIPPESAEDPRGRGSLR